MLVLRRSSSFCFESHDRKRKRSRRSYLPNSLSLSLGGLHLVRRLSKECLNFLFVGVTVLTLSSCFKFEEKGQAEMSEEGRSRKGFCLEVDR